MRKLFFVIAITFLFSPGLVFSQVKNSKSIPVHTEADMRLQRKCEQEVLQYFRSTEVTKGPEYRILIEVTKAFGLRQPPRLYLVDRGSNAGYIVGSVWDGRGKIFIARSLILFLGDPWLIKGVMAHEMAHLVSDEDMPGCKSKVSNNVEEEKAADALAARLIGFGPIQAILVRGLSLPGMDHIQINMRLRMFLDPSQKRQ